MSTKQFWAAFKFLLLVFKPVFTNNASTGASTRKEEVLILVLYVFSVK